MDSFLGKSDVASRSTILCGGVSGPWPGLAGHVRGVLVLPSGCWAVVVQFWYDVRMLG